MIESGWIILTSRNLTPKKTGSLIRETQLRPEIRVGDDNLSRLIRSVFLRVQHDI